MMTTATCHLIPEPYLKEKADELFRMAPLRKPFPKSMPRAGVILIDDPFGGHNTVSSGDMRRYARRTCSANPKSWLADRITRDLTGIVTPDYRADGDRTLINLENDPLWHETRNEVLRRLPECDIRYVEERNELKRKQLKSYIEILVSPPPKPDDALSPKERERLQQMRS